MLAEKETLETSLKSLKITNSDDSEFSKLKNNFQILLDSKSKQETNFQLERKRFKVLLIY